MNLADNGDCSNILEGNGVTICFDTPADKCLDTPMFKSGSCASNGFTSKCQLDDFTMCYEPSQASNCNGAITGNC